jgi:hypothetical protein
LTPSSLDIPSGMGSDGVPHVAVAGANGERSAGGFAAIAY